MKNALKIWVALILLVTMDACRASRTNPKEHYAAVAAQPVDVIVVPGNPFNGVAWDSVMKGRIIWAYILWKNGLTKNIIFSGAAVYTPFVESKIYGLYAMELGVPAKNIFYDTLAEHSTENLYYGYLLAKQLGFKSIALATDPVQAFTLTAYSRNRFASKVALLPFVVDSLSKYNHLNPLIPIKGQWRSDFQSIKEREGFWKRWRGTLGRNIPWEKYPEGKLPAL